MSANLYKKQFENEIRLKNLCVQNFNKLAGQAADYYKLGKQIEKDYKELQLNFETTQQDLIQTKRLSQIRENQYKELKKEVKFLRDEIQQLMKNANDIRHNSRHNGPNSSRPNGPNTNGPNIRNKRPDFNEILDLIQNHERVNIAVNKWINSQGGINKLEKVQKKAKRVHPNKFPKDISENQRKKLNDFVKVLFGKIL